MVCMSMSGKNIPKNLIFEKKIFLKEEYFKTFMFPEPGKDSAMTPVWGFLGKNLQKHIKSGFVVHSYSKHI